MSFSSGDSETPDARLLAALFIVAVMFGVAVAMGLFGVMT